METSANITKISAALLKAQSAMGNAVKDSKNPFFKSSYADLNSVLEACLPLLNANGISALQPMVTINGKNFVNTILLHESGEWLSSLTEIVYAKVGDAQAQGSGITYARRYGLQAFVNIGADDDDGHKASEQPKNKINEQQKTFVKKDEKPDLTENSEQFKKAKKFIQDGGTVEDIEKKYKVSETVALMLVS